MNGSGLPKLAQPTVSLWNTEAPLILWINDGFKQSRHLELRGLDHHPFRFSFGTSDRGEAIKRQNLVRLLIENQELRWFALLDYFKYDGELINIPNDGQKFVNYFDPQNQNLFWKKIGEFSDIMAEVEAAHPDLDSSNHALVSMVQYLRNEKERLEGIESRMGSEVIEELLKATSVDGTVTLQLRYQEGRWRFVVTTKEAVGHRLYALNPPKDGVSIPSQWDKTLWHKLGVYEWLLKRATKRKEQEIRAWAKPIIITACPNEISRDICAHMNNVLEQSIESGGFPVPDDGKTKLVDLVFRFTYRSNGLRIKLVGLSGNQEIPEKYEKNWMSKPADQSFRYYSEEDKAKMVAMRLDIVRRSYVTHLLTNY